VAWDQRFYDPIELCGRKPLVMLRDAAQPSIWAMMMLGFAAIGFMTQTRPIAFASISSCDAASLSPKRNFLAHRTTAGPLLSGSVNPPDAVSKGSAVGRGTLLFEAGKLWTSLRCSGSMRANIVRQGDEEDCVGNSHAAIDIAVALIVVIARSKK